MIRAAGVIFLSKSTGRILLNLRAENVPKGGVLGFWGGKINNNETLNEGLARELLEEMGGEIHPYIKSIPIDVYNSPDNKFQYYSYVIIVDNEFCPKLNEESDGYAWITIGKWPKMLHPGAKMILYNKTIIKALHKFAVEK